MSELVEFRMPDVGEGIAEAEVLAWFAEVGDTVEADGPLCQVETDKSIVEIPAPATGTLLQRCVEVGQVALVGELLVVIGDPAALPPQGVAGPAAAPTPAPAPSGAVLVAAAPVTPGARPKASPRTRRLAVRRGIDLGAVRGTGPYGRITEADLDAPQPMVTAARAASPRPAGDRADEVVELRGLRRSIARSMTEALAIPHVTEFREVDATHLLAARAALKPSFEERGVRLSVFPLLLKAVVRALELVPSMNASYDASTEVHPGVPGERLGAGVVARVHRRDQLQRPDDGLEQEREDREPDAGVHLGMATATDDGLIVPVVRDADLLSLTGLTQEVERLAERARTRTATPEELTGGSFTVTNFGSFGTWLGNPVIRPPEVGIAGFGRITEKVLAVDGQVVVRPVLPIVVAADHRINDGAHLAEFVNAVAAAVAQPLLLLS